MDEVTFHPSYQTEANPSAPSPVEQEKHENYLLESRKRKQKQAQKDMNQMEWHKMDIFSNARAKTLSILH